MARAGHSDFKTTQLYIDLAGETFRAEAELLEQRLFGVGGYQKTGTNSGARCRDGEREPRLSGAFSYSAEALWAKNFWFTRRVGTSRAPRA